MRLQQRSQENEAGLACTAGIFWGAVFSMLWYPWKPRSGNHRHAWSMLIVCSPFRQTTTAVVPVVPHDNRPDILLKGGPSWEFEKWQDEGIPGTPQD